MTRPSPPHHPAVGVDLFRDAPCGYVVTDDDGAIVAANAELHHLLGLGPGADLTGRPLSSLLSPGGRIYLETHLLPVLEHDSRVREVSLDLVREDGTRVPVLMNAARAPGTRSGLLAVFLETRDRFRYEQDLLNATKTAQRARAEAVVLAQTLQHTLLPPAPPAVPHLAIAATYRPAGDGSEVGGDFYDFFQVAPGRWVVTLGDVSGKGVAAAALTSFIRYAIRDLAVVRHDPADLLRGLDQLLLRHDTPHYCTVVVMFLEESAGRWTVRLALGGHPAPLVRGPDGSVNELGVHGSVVGLVPDASFVTTEHTLGDDTVVLYTDGVTEARTGGELYGEQRLVDLLARTPGDPDTLTHAVAEAVLAFQDDVASDDIAVVALAASTS